MDRARLERFGVVPEYPDIFGRWHAVGDDTAREVLRAMGVPGDAEAPPDVDGVVVARVGEERPGPHGELELEDGGSRAIGGIIPSDLPLGYHTLHRTDGREVSVIVAPGWCRRHPGRMWGLAAQVYALRSASSWGVGDLGDLAQLGRWARAEGAGVVLVNPMDAVIAMTPRQTSPYYPSSRRFKDVLYLDVGAVPGIGSVADRLPPLAAAARGEADPTRGARIDRDVVTQAKLAALELVWARPGSGDEPGFARFLAEQGDALVRFATFQTLAERHGAGWRSFPPELRDPAAPAVADLARAHADRIRFHAWVQWLLDEQLAAAAAAAPLMRDLPVGVDPDGADAWEWQDVLADGVTVGAPPDELGPQGQDWRVPAFVPWKLRAAAYRPYIDTLRASFRHASALRIDHVLGLFRLFWIPSGDPTRGAYVRQPADELLDILALESHRAGAYVVGEDLGTVEPGVREALSDRDVLRYRVLWFEEQPPEHWGAAGLGAITTHDLPTVAGLVSGEDLLQVRAAGVDTDEASHARMRARLAERAGPAVDAGPDEACVAAAGVLGRSGCDVVVMQLEDLVAARHRINVPGTDAERPDNWSIPLPVDLEDLPGHPTARRVLDALRAARPVQPDDRANAL